MFTKIIFLVHAEPFFDHEDKVDGMFSIKIEEIFAFNASKLTHGPVQYKEIEQQDRPSGKSTGEIMLTKLNQKTFIFLD